jgi:hypothetical protein
MSATKFRTHTKPEAKILSKTLYKFKAKLRFRTSHRRYKRYYLSGLPVAPVARHIIVRIFHRFKTTLRNTQNYTSVVHECRSVQEARVTTPHVHASYTQLNKMWRQLPWWCARRRLWSVLVCCAFIWRQWKHNNRLSGQLITGSALALNKIHF